MRMPFTTRKYVFDGRVLKGSCFSTTVAKQNGFLKGNSEIFI